MGAKKAGGVFVEVVQFDNSEVVRRMGPMSEAKAERVERGLLINMDTDRFFVRTVDSDGKDA